VDFIEHGESCNSASLLHWLPFQRAQHICNTGSASVPVGDKSGSSSLYSFKLFGSCCSVWVPNGLAVYQQRTYKRPICSLGLHNFASVVFDFASMSHRASSRASYGDMFFYMLTSSCVSQ